MPKKEVPNVICIYYKEDGDSKWSADIYDKADYPISTFDEFCKYVIHPAVDMLRKKGYTVYHGYVSTLTAEDERRSQEYLERFA